MDKNEILERAQKERNDEMELQIRDKSMKYTYIVMVIVAAIFTFIRAEQGLPMMDLSATVCFSVCAGHIYRYVKGKDKGTLVIAIITFVVGVMATIRFAMGH